MAYNPVEQNNNGVNEIEYLQDFMRNQVAIEAYKRTRGGSYEDAYRAVVGTPWPDGRSVKISNGQPEMTKDRTFKSVMGKYVLPIAAGAVGGFGLAGMGPLGGVLGLGGGGTAAGAGETAAGVGGGAASTAGTTAGITSNPATWGLIPESVLVNPQASQALSAAYNTAASQGGNAITRFLSNLGSKDGLGIDDILGTIGAGITGASQAAANNRGVELEAAIVQEELRQRGYNNFENQLIARSDLERNAANTNITGYNNFENQLIARSQDDRASGSDAWIKSMIANKVANNPGYQPGSVMGQMLPTFGTGMRPSTAAMTADANALRAGVSKRLNEGSQLPTLAPYKPYVPTALPAQQPYTPYTNDPELLKAHGGERMANWLGPALNILGPNPYGPPTSTKRTT